MEEGILGRGLWHVNFWHAEARCSGGCSGVTHHRVKKDMGLQGTRSLEEGEG